MKKIISLCMGLSVLAISEESFSQTLSIGVASNFYSTIKAITQKLHQENQDLNFTIINASSTVLTAQITNGSKIDIFFSADQQKPDYIYKNKNKFHLKNMEKPFPYAQGKLVYYTYKKNLSAINDSQIKNTIIHDNFVIANPKKAPYGLASKEYIENTLHMNMEDLKNHTILRNNIGLTFSTVYMGNVNSGFVAYSSIISKKIPLYNYKILNSGYSPILQYAVILNNNTLSHKLINFMKQPRITKIITDNGYIIPK